MHKNNSHYISLFSIFIAGILGFYFYSYDRPFQIAVLFALAISYVSWGVVHHILHKDINLAIILEYVTVSVLGLIMVMSLIFRT